MLITKLGLLTSRRKRRSIRDKCGRQFECRDSNFIESYCPVFHKNLCLVVSLVLNRNVKASPSRQAMPEAQSKAI